jgi:primary-amine oxidase
MSSGFSLMPSGFFNLNPSNDLPREVNKASVLADGGAPACHC